MKFAKARGKYIMADYASLFWGFLECFFEKNGIFFKKRVDKSKKNAKMKVRNSKN